MMRRIITMVIMAAVFMLYAKAEDHYVPHISMGVHGGASMAKVSFSPSIPQLWDRGITGGISIRYAEEKLVGILAEINFEQRGWAENFEKSPLRYSRTLSYISMPVMTHVYFGSHRCKCFFNIGPEFSYLIGQKTDSNFDYTDPAHAEGWPEDTRMTQQLTMQVKNKFDYGLCVGVGVEYYLKPRNSIYLEFRYYYGLGNIFPATKADTFGASRNMTMALTAGYNFRLK